MQTIEKVYAKTWQELALHFVHQAKARYDAYEQDVREWYEHGDGRSYANGGKGHTYPYCIHGVSRWVDYDCACGACEDGDGDFEYLRELGNAKYAAKAAFEMTHNRIQLYVDISTKVRNEGLPVVIDKDGWNDYVMAPVEMRK